MKHETRVKISSRSHTAHPIKAEERNLENIKDMISNEKFKIQFDE